MGKDWGGTEIKRDKILYWIIKMGNLILIMITVNSLISSFLVLILYSVWWKIIYSYRPGVFLFSLNIGYSTLILLIVYIVPRSRENMFVSNQCSYHQKNYFKIIYRGTDQKNIYSLRKNNGPKNVLAQIFKRNSK